MIEQFVYNSTYGIDLNRNLSSSKEISSTSVDLGKAIYLLYPVELLRLKNIKSHFSLRNSDQ